MVKLLPVSMSSLVRNRRILISKDLVDEFYSEFCCWTTTLPFLVIDVMEVTFWPARHKLAYVAPRMDWRSFQMWKIHQCCICCCSKAFCDAFKILKKNIFTLISNMLGLFQSVTFVLISIWKNMQIYIFVTRYEHEYGC